MAMVDYALWAPLFLMGILAATFSSALGSIIGAPRILQALADELPFSFMRETPEFTKSSCLFIKDSGLESALA
jgi:amino acid transporter